MQNPQREKRQHRIRRHARVRARVLGTPVRPRIVVFKSNTAVYIQAVDDRAGKTIAALRSNAKAGKQARLPEELKHMGAKSKYAFAAGQALAARLKEKDIAQAVFDKGGSKYHGRVKAVADGLRAGGIKI